MSDDSAAGAANADLQSTPRVTDGANEQSKERPGVAQAEDFLAQTARIPFADLQRYFAAGKLVRVIDTLDLISVAVALANDKTSLFSEWLASGKVAPVSDDEANRWLAQEQGLWAVVVDPWVLVQDRRAAQATE